MKKSDFDPFEKDAIVYLIDKSEGHPSTLSSLCYLSLEIASFTAADASVTEEITREAWKKFPNKKLHEEAVAWYRKKELYME